ncbi:UPF0481 protein At3g47200 isoform X2 [Cannabis sativa]|uniref:Uncharacterized protein n=2 Tax=Cannabis sativa TaxID=3483 RepID=A0A803QFJ5_CANSA|nr:UPF0481 protein At3g47200 isoform X2 [Cannabis sativa]XP_030479797.1 UPF0481 protein At3g47200 isoform X2 [Cannabis sativa]
MEENRESIQAVIINVDENQSYSPLNSLRSELDRPPLLFKDRCIYRVPKRLRDGNDKAYTPQVVSIGPFHHGNQNVKPMEDHKKRYLRNYLLRTGKELEYYVNIIKEKEYELRSCYAETIPFSSDEFVKIVLLDAVFIIEILLVFKYRTGIDLVHDHIFNRPWMVYDIRSDLLLLENQLPFFIFEHLFNPVPNDLCHDEPISTAKLAHSFFEDMPLVSINREGHSNSHSSQHFVDLFRMCVLPLEQSSKMETTSNLPSAPNPHDGPEDMTCLNRILGLYILSISNDGPEPNTYRTVHFVDLFRKFFAFLVKQKPEMGNTPNLPSAKKLHQAGVKFKAKAGENLLDIQFTFSQGILEIPILQVDDSTETLLRNLVAFEQCHYNYHPYICMITHYVVLLDYLVNTAEDVDLLVKYGIINNLLGDNSQVATMINKLGDGVFYENNENYHFAEILGKLHKYCETPWHKWNANLRQNYFHSPWAGLSVVAAVFLIILTFIQTVCSVISVIKD